MTVRRKERGGRRLSRRSEHSVMRAHTHRRVSEGEKFRGKGKRSGKEDRGSEFGENILKWNSERLMYEGVRNAKGPEKKKGECFSTLNNS